MVTPRRLRLHRIAPRAVALIVFAAFATSTGTRLSTPAQASAARGGGQARVQLVRTVSGPTQFTEACGDPDAIPGAEVEPHLAVNPADPDHLVATWQQDRHSTGGAARSNLVASSRDGGATWTRNTIPNLTSCTATDNPPKDPNHRVQPRATDPWVAVGVGGTAYHASTTVLDTDHVELDLPIAASADGGLSWPSPVPVATDDGTFWHEKPEIAADPVKPGHAYAVWLRHLTPDPADVEGTLDVDMAFARTEDGGRTWSWSDDAPSIIPPDVEGRVEGAMDMVVVPRPDGGSSIVVGFGVFSDRLTASAVEMFTTRSEDGGDTWSPPGRIGAVAVVRTFDTERPPPTANGFPFIEGGEANVPQIATAPDGTLYAVWQQHMPTGSHPYGDTLIHVARSTDLGSTWSTVETMQIPAPVQLPKVAVASDGTVGVSFSDFRADVWGPTDGNELRTVLWLRYSRDRGENWTELRLAGPYDMRQAPLDSGGLRYMLGDYVGMVGLTRGFGVLVAVAPPVATIDPACCPAGVRGQSDILFVRVKLPS